MKKTLAVRGSLVGLSVCLHGIAAIQFQRELPRTDVPPAWIGEFSILLAVSLGTSIPAILARSPRTRNLLLGIQLVLLILMGIPEGRSLAIETLLTTLLVLECVLLNALPWNLLFAVSTILIMTLMQRANITFLEPIAKPSLPWLVAFTAMTSLAGSLAFVVTRVTGRLEEQNRLIERLDTTISRLTDANVGFQRYASEVESESVGRERNRISREIHDTVGYTITALIMLMEAASDLADAEPERLKLLLQQGIDQAIYSLDEIRRSLRELRAMELPSLHGLRAIRRMILAFEEATGVRVSLDFSNIEWNFDEDTNQVFYRMIQESLANAFRHGGATRVSVVFSQTERDVRVSIRDNGNGSAEIHEGIGLSGMRERIARLNGRVRACGVADGFLISAVVPLDEEGVGRG